jgi:hypothetical protein
MTTIIGTTNEDFPTVTFTEVLDNPTSGGTVTGLTSQDAIYSAVTSNGVDVNALVNVAPRLEGVFNNSTIENLTPSVASYDSITKKLTKVGAGGTARINVNTYGLSHKEYSVIVNQRGSVVTNVVTGGVTGSLMKHLWDNINGFVNAKSPSPSTMALYNGSLRNPDLFCNYNLTGFSFSGQNHTLLSPLHYITANHAFGGRAGDTVQFLGSDGSLHQRTIVADKYNPLIGDSRVGIYDEALPATVTPFKLLPTNYKTRLPSSVLGLYKYPSITVSAHALNTLAPPNDTNTKTLILTAIGSVQNSILIYENEGSVPVMNNYPFIQGTTPLDGWSKKNTPTGDFGIAGDSNHPTFFPISGELILLGNQATAYKIPDYAASSGLIQTAMTALSTENSKAQHTIGYANLTIFTGY